MLKVRALININNLILTISLSAVILGCASNPTSQSKFKKNSINAISKNTLSSAGEPINTDTSSAHDKKTKKSVKAKA